VSAAGRCKFPGSFFGRPAVLLLALALMAAGTAPAHAADPTALEKQVKSAFVVNFLQFIDWPATAFAKPDDPIIIGVADPNSLGDTLAAAIEGKTIRGRKLVIRNLDPKAPGACHVLVAGSLEGSDLQALLKAAPASGCLTIGDSDHFTESSGVIRFFVEDRKERFEINLAAAQRAGLQISSKLLKLAKVMN
jgi:hypothetical protein